jgi:hypothetical protein
LDELKYKNMPVGRKGHAAAVAEIGEVESVIVAGGWDIYGKELASVSMFMPYEDKWVNLSDMPAFRVDYTLQVNN